MGSLLLRALSGVFLRIPFSKYASMGSEASAGSGRPADLSPLRYERIVPQLTDSDNSAANWQIMCSLSGRRVPKPTVMSPARLVHSSGRFSYSLANESLNSRVQSSEPQLGLLRTSSCCGMVPVDTQREKVRRCCVKLHPPLC